MEIELKLFSLIYKNTSFYSQNIFLHLFTLNTVIKRKKLQKKLFILVDALASIKCYIKPNHFALRFETARNIHKILSFYKKNNLLF